jgi:hypothetical protein
VNLTMRLIAPLFTIYRLLWAAPCSLLGLMIAAALMLAGGRMRYSKGALECALGNESAFAEYMLRHQNTVAFTMGHVILAWRAEDLQRWHAHERVHVKQYERWGVLMLLAYPAASLWAWLQGKDPYSANHFEQEAYQAGRGA